MDAQKIQNRLPIFFWYIVKGRSTLGTSSMEDDYRLTKNSRGIGQRTACSDEEKCHRIFFTWRILYHVILHPIMPRFKQQKQPCFQYHVSSRKKNTFQAGKKPRFKQKKSHVSSTPLSHVSGAPHVAMSQLFHLHLESLTRAFNLAIVPENTFQNSPKTIHPRKLSHPPAGHLALEVLG